LNIFWNDNDKYKFIRNLQTLNNDTLDVEVSNQYFINNCTHALSLAGKDASWAQIAIQRFNSFFQNNNDLINQIQSILMNPDSNTDLSSTIINIIQMLIPLLILFFFSLVGWFTCCSCCCYEYCPIICKKNDNIPYENSTKLIPVIVVAFSGFSLLTPTIIAYSSFQGMQSAILKGFCQLALSNFAIRE
jgi:hypothetical protein